MLSWVYYPMLEHSRCRLYTVPMKIPTVTGERFHLRQLNRLFLFLLFALSASLGTQTAARAGNVYVDRTLQAQLATLGPIAQIQAVVNFDPAVRSGAALASAIRSIGAGTITFNNLDSVGVLATSGQINAVARLAGVTGIYANRQTGDRVDLSRRDRKSTRLNSSHL